MSEFSSEDMETLLFLYFDGELNSAEAKAIELLMEQNEQARLLAYQIQESQRLTQNYFSLQQAYIERAVVKCSAKQRVNLLSRVGRLFYGPLVAYSTFLVMTALWPVYNYKSGNREDDITRSYLLTMQLTEQICRDIDDNLFVDSIEFDAIIRT